MTVIAPNLFSSNFASCLVNHPISQILIRIYQDLFVFCSANIYILKYVTRKILNYLFKKVKPESKPLANSNKDVSVSIRSEEHTSELQSRPHLVCRLLLEKKKKIMWRSKHII